MIASNELSIEGYLARLAEKAGASAERVEALHQKYQEWQQRFCKHPLFRQIHAKAVKSWQFLRDPEVPKRQKAIVLAAVAYVLLPFDLVPDWLPVVGLVDDLAAMTVALAIVDQNKVAAEAPGEASSGDAEPSKGQTT